MVKEQNYKWLLYLISLTILITVGAQVYWNFQQYELEKRTLSQLYRTVLDEAVEKYYGEITKKHVGRFQHRSIETHPLRTETDVEILLKSDTPGEFEEHIRIFNDSSLGESRVDIRKFTRKSGSHQELEEDVFKLRSVPFDSLITKVFVAFSSDTLRLDELKSIVDSSLVSRNVFIPNQLRYGTKLDSGLVEVQTIGASLEHNSPEVQSQSVWLTPGMSLSLRYSNDTMVLLRGISGSIILSLILSLLIIFCLLFALKTIAKQKRLSNMKNDLISNVSHEFKTPISTIKVALESLQHYTEDHDQKKRKEYIAIAQNQVKNLTSMVEYLLEAAKANGNELTSDFKELSLSDILKKLVKRVEMLSPDMEIILDLPNEPAIHLLDGSQIEKGFMNVLDNAIKYGGNRLNIRMRQELESTLVEIWDNGQGIPQKEHSLVFEQFYRRQGGNIHETRGYGIGLYLTKKIVEHHGGNVKLENRNGHSTFIFELPR